MPDFQIKQPDIKDPNEIEKLSMETIVSELANYPAFEKFLPEEQKIIQRMIHATTCFDQIINNIYFSPNAIKAIIKLLKAGAVIISDTNMIKAGISKTYTDKYNNLIVCNVADPEIKDISEKSGTTRTVAAVRKALNDFKDMPVILACGNAPTFLYAAIEKIVQENWDFSNIAILAMPVGFVNVEDSKDYTLDFIDVSEIEGIVLNGRYGGSTLIVSVINAIYKLIC